MFVVCLLLIRMWVSILLSSNAYFFWLVTSRHVTHLAYTWTCVCNEPEIKVRQHSREDIKVIYDPGRCYENLPFYFFFYFLFSKNPRLCTLDPRHVTLDPRLCTLDPRPSTKTQTPARLDRNRKPRIKSLWHPGYQTTDNKERLGSI